MDELRKRQKIISQLVEARLEQGISQAELARRLGIQRSGINRLESGTQNPTLDMILKIASALGKDVSLELNDKEEPMSHVYSLRMYDTELMRFSMEKQGLSGLVAEIREILQRYYFFRISIVSEAIISSSSVGITTTFT